MLAHIGQPASAERKFPNQRYFAVKQPDSTLDIIPDSRTANRPLLSLPGRELEAEAAPARPWDVDGGEVGGAKHGAVGAFAEADYDFVGAEGDAAFGGDEAPPDGVGRGGPISGEASSEPVVASWAATVRVVSKSTLRATAEDRASRWKERMPSSRPCSMVMRFA
jgi:hypothetical protein